jgi:DNA-binding NarL/FixJ family response regulator
MEPYKCRVLLVDDHVPIRIALRNVLAEYTDVQIVGEACDGAQAVEQVAACQPDVILMDIRMPRMNGIEAARVIKKSWQEVAIIGLCTVQDLYTTETFLKAGALAVISKDRVEDLHSTIQRACPTRRSAA